MDFGIHLATPRRVVHEHTARVDACGPVVYERRRPERTVLYQTLQHHLEPFIAELEARADRALPYFVKKELRDFLGCGILANGFLRVRCPQCRHDRVVSFSCKHRGFCPSCGGRRMAETAAHLVDEVIPEVPVRQWVLTLPYRLRYRLLYDHDACTIALRAFVRTVFNDLRRRAKKRHGVTVGKPGGVTFIQRFASSLAGNVHFHSVFFDGVYTKRDDGSTRFVPLPPPTDGEVVTLTKKVGRSVRRALVRAGKMLDELDPEPDSLAEDEPALAALYGSSVVGRVATGARAGRQVERVGDRVDADDAEALASPRCARIQGFSLHADVAVPARDRKRLERLLRYVARPPIATERLHRRTDGKLLYLFREPWRDGTRGVVYTPAELIEKLVALIPPPQANMLRYHGVLAPGSKLRQQVINDRRQPIATNDGCSLRWDPRPCAMLGLPKLDGNPPVRGVSGIGACLGDPSHPPMVVGGLAKDAVPTRLASELANGSGDRCGPGAGSPRRMSWATLMKRVFEIDVLECPVCQGPMKIIAEITQRDVIRRFLAALDLPTEAPRVQRARPPPQLDLGWDDGPADSMVDDDASMLQSGA